MLGAPLASSITMGQSNGSLMRAIGGPQDPPAKKESVNNRWTRAFAITPTAVLLILLPVSLKKGKEETKKAMHQVASFLSGIAE